MPNSLPFCKSLLGWYDAGHRDLPWRQSNDFYRVWISEIMLQQTRVEAVIPYYERFLALFPDIQALASAAEPDVLAAWSGLGYYSRARNLRRAAQQIAGTGVPETLDQIRALPGIGPYTAAAIASIALGQPYAAVDGNVVRVISRLTNGEGNIPDVAETLLDRERPGDFNQAMMELGATVCVPGNPKCQVCPVTEFCKAYAAGTQREMPARVPKKAGPEVELDLVVFEDSDRIFLVQRAAGERRMADFWELPRRQLFPRVRATLRHEFKHQIVNQRHRVKVWTAPLPKAFPEGRWFTREHLGTIALTTISRKAIQALR